MSNVPEPLLKLIAGTGLTEMRTANGRWPASHPCEQCEGLTNEHVYYGPDGWSAECNECALERRRPVPGGAA